MGRVNKHNARKHTATVGGQECHFDSMAEHRYADWLEREGLDWTHHPTRVPVLVRGHEAFVIEPDFAVLVGGELEYHEVKGMATAAWRLKRRVQQLAHPERVYVVIDAGRGVCATGEGAPAPFDERPRRKRKSRVLRKATRNRKAVER